MEKLLIICGPTATGKTKLALQLAKKFNGELISADSRQVYKGLDVLTGKDLPEQCQKPALSIVEGSNLKILFKKKIYNIPAYIIHEIPVWMYDVVDPDEEFSVAHFQALASAVIADVIKRGKLPIVVGGTGLYIRSLTHLIETISVPQDSTIRKELSLFSLEQLQEALQKEDAVNWAGMNRSDNKNPRRLVRALEVAQWRKNYYTAVLDTPPYDLLWIGLQLDMEVLKSHIRSRVIARIDGGALTEVEKYSIKNTELPVVTSLGITLVKQFLHQKLSRQELIDKWTNEEFSYAKRQMTWFGKEKSILWVDTGEKNFDNLVEQHVRSWYTNGRP